MFKINSVNATKNKIEFTKVIDTIKSPTLAINLMIKIVNFMCFVF